MGLQRKRNDMSDNEELVQHANEDIDGVNTDEIFESLEDVPEEKRKVIEKLMVSSFQMRGMISPENTISKKITEEHISQYLEGAREDMKNSYAEKKQRKIFLFLSMLISMIFFVIVIVILKDKPDIMEKIIYTLGGLVAGAFGGYGFGKKKSDD